MQTKTFTLTVNIPDDAEATSEGIITYLSDYIMGDLKGTCPDVQETTDRQMIELATKHMLNPVENPTWGSPGWEREEEEPLTISLKQPGPPADERVTFAFYEDGSLRDIQVERDE